MAEGRTPIVLASGSPRRLELLRRIGIEPLVRPAEIDETPREAEAPAALVARLARTKAERVDGEGAVVIGADTVVVLGGEVLGKPADDADAVRMLRALAGRDHQVLTAVHVIHGGRAASAVARTTVRMRELGDEEIAAYVATGEPADKAGGYALQGVAGMFVTAIDGEESAVVGLPLATLAELLRDVGEPMLPAKPIPHRA